IVLRRGGGTGRCDIAACVARALQTCPGRACLAFLLRPQEVRRVDNTCTQCAPKTLGSLVQYIPSCRLKGNFWDVRPRHSCEQPTETCRWMTCILPAVCHRRVFPQNPL